MSHETQAIAVTCIDFRFQKFIQNWLDEKLGDKNYDRVAIAGGIFDLPYVLKQIEISHRLHHIKTAILINHEDCGAYGEAGTHERHLEDLNQAAKVIKNLYPDLNVDLYYLKLSGEFESVNV